MNIKITVLTVAALLTLFVASCKKNNDPEPNLPPAAFTVTPKLATSGTDVVLTWTQAKDPNGDPVTYAVVYKDTLAKNLTDTTYTIKNVGYGATVAGSVVASDNQKASVSAKFSITTVANPYVAIPDVNFEKALIALKIDDVQDGKLLLASALKVTNLDISYKSINNLQGIEYFANLASLDCHYNNLTNLDISKNIALMELSCNQNSLKSLDVTKNILLKLINCGTNQITSLDVSKNPSLLTISCENNDLTTLDVSKNTALEVLLYSPRIFSGTSLTSLDVSRNTSLKRLNCYGNKITSLDLSKNKLLTYLNCYGNDLTTLDLSNNTALTELNCGLNELTSLDVSKNTKMDRLDFFANSLTTIDLKNNKLLEYVRCNQNKLTSLDLRNQTILSSLYCDSNKIQTICLYSLSLVNSFWSKDATAVYKVCQ